MPSCLEACCFDSFVKEHQIIDAVQALYVVQNHLFLKRRVHLIPRMHRLEYTLPMTINLSEYLDQPVVVKYLVALAMTRRDGLSSRMIQSRRISTLPSFWNHVSISTESPLSRSAPSIPRNFKSQNHLIFTASN